MNTTELRRLEALRGYDILDTEPEPAFDSLIQVAAAICQTPVSLISLVDADRCWFKANLGLDGMCEAPREIAFAKYVVDDPHEPFIVEDAQNDPRFMHGPLANGQPPMRFYCGTPLVNPEGYVLGSLCVIDHQPRRLESHQVHALKTLARQITTNFEQRRMLRKVEKLNTELEQAYREMESFSYSVSHDLKAPLRAIEGYAQILEEDYTEQLDEDGREMLQRMIDSTQNMRTLVDGILNLSRISRKPLVRTPTDLSAMAREIFAKIADRGNAILCVADELTAVGDVELIRVTLQNLLENAVKYSSKRERPEIEVGKTETDRGTAFFVRDNGAGFNTKYYKKLFQLFQRLHKPSEFSGTGIGLSIVEKVIKRHHGQIWAESEPDRGATFYFTLNN